MLKGFNFTGLSFETLSDLLDATAYLVGIVDEGRYARRFPDVWHDAMQGLVFALAQQVELYQTNNPDEFELDPDADLGETQEYDASDWLPEPVIVPDDAISAFTSFFETWLDDDDNDNESAVAS